jgi:hypothetical protein
MNPDDFFKKIDDFTVSIENLIIENDVHPAVAGAVICKIFPTLCVHCNMGDEEFKNQLDSMLKIYNLCKEFHHERK